MIPFTFFTPDEVDSPCLKLDWPGKIAFSRVNFPDLELEIDLEGEALVARKYLQTAEFEKFSHFSREKRRVEWLAGRIAAKYAALSLQGDKRSLSDKSWQDCHIAAKKSGRPYIALRNNPPDISISHSGQTAVAMACSIGRCGIDIQEISEKIFRVKEKFAEKNEIHLYQQNSHLINVDFGEFLTLLWAAKEALRKGVNTVPITGFLELQLQEISGNRVSGIIFKFIFTRPDKKDGATLLQTYQILTDNFALASFLGNPKSL